MKSAGLPVNEKQRIKRLEELDILDTLEEQAYDDLTLLAAQICDTPIALVSLVDEQRQWFKSHHGLDASETPREVAFCAHAILGDDLFIVEDPTQDERFHDNPLVTGGPEVKFYAGAPLIMQNNLRLGTLCVIANEPRTLSESQKAALLALSRQVVSLLELRIKVKQLEHLDHAKDEFISMVSHELRTPLTSINGSLSLLTHSKSGKYDDKAKKLVDIAYRNTGQLLSIVNDILDLSKMEAGYLEINKQPLDIIALLQQVVGLNTAYCESQACTLVFNNPGQIPSLTLHADEQRLIQVMTNLISNAAKFTHDGDRIEISCSIDNDKVHIGVTDHGPGIPQDQQEYLFKRFKQLGPPVNQKMPGTGLGLNISKHIVEIHNGEIGFESVPDEHTTLRFWLPLNS